jgi:DNA-binding NarL/FixJ family response regulator
MAIRELAETHPEVKSVLLLPASERDLVIDAFRAGAKGVFCSGQNGVKMLCMCVTRVHEGQIWANSSELGYVIEAFSHTSSLRTVNADGMRLLTDREEHIVRLVADGLTNREIALQLNLSEHTVKNYLFRMFDKLGVSSRVELVLYAICSTRRPASSGCERCELKRPNNVEVSSSVSRNP